MASFGSVNYSSGKPLSIILCQARQENSWGQGQIINVGLLWITGMSGAKTLFCKFFDMWSLKVCPGKILNLRLNLRVISAVAKSQYLRSTEYSTFLIAKNLRI